MRPRVRLAASVLAVGLVAAAGTAGWSWTGERDPVLRVDGVTHACPRSGTVGVGLTLVGRGEARFAVDGVEVPSARSVVAGFPEATAALLAEPVRFVRCDDRVAHRYTIVTSEPGACRWTVSPADESQAEARGDHGSPIASGAACSIVVGA